MNDIYNAKFCIDSISVVISVHNPNSNPNPKK